MPRPVLDLPSSVELATDGDFTMREALVQARDVVDTDPAKRRFRDAFLAAQMQAIDARYYFFRSRLSAQMKGANFGLELGVLGLTSAGAIAGERAANILSAGAAGLTGTRAALAKEVYFEKTLPALIASMEARRLGIKADIVRKMREADVATYSIPQAILDLDAYRGATTLDGAIEKLTADAAADRDAAETEYESVVRACRAEQGVGAVWRRIRAALNELAPEQKATLDQVSAIVGSNAASDFAAQRSLVLAQLPARYCTVQAATGLVEAMQEAGVTFR